MISGRRAQLRTTDPLTSKNWGTEERDKPLALPDLHGSSEDTKLCRPMELQHLQPQQTDMGAPNSMPSACRATRWPLLHTHHPLGHKHMYLPSEAPVSGLHVLERRGEVWLLLQAANSAVPAKGNKESVTLCLISLMTPTFLLGQSSAAAQESSWPNACYQVSASGDSQWRGMDSSAGQPVPPEKRHGYLHLVHMPGLSASHSEQYLHIPFPHLSSSQHSTLLTFSEHSPCSR